jgi:hypothetical protein
MHAGFENYQNIRNRASEDYKKLRKMRCPVLNNEYIYFNNAGFRHLIRKDKIRSRAEQIERFQLLPYIKEIIIDPDSMIQYRKKILDELITHYWSLTSIQDEKLIKVIIRQIGEGKKHFYSIFRVA